MPPGSIGEIRFQISLAVAFVDTPAQVTVATDEQVPVAARQLVPKRGAGESPLVVIRSGTPGSPVITLTNYSLV